MSDVKLSRQDLREKLQECRAMAIFLADAVNLILEENGSYRTGVHPVPYGASACIMTLAEKITAIEQAT